MKTGRRQLKRLEISLRRSWRKRESWAKPLAGGFLAVLLAGSFALVLTIALIEFEVFGPMPDKNELQTIHHPVASEIYTADSVLMGKFYVQNRLDMEAGEIPQSVVSALLATEDVRFYQHRGIDFRSLGRVLVKTLMFGDEHSGGGSTLTQQLAKNLYPRREYAVGSIVINKLREMVMAYELERLYTKNELMVLYLNTVPFGENTYGLKAAAFRYFNKLPQDLTVQESAMLVGMLKGPSRYSPRLHYDRAMERRNLVLGQMAKYGMIETTLRDSLQHEPIQLNYTLLTHFNGIAPYFRDHLKEELRGLLGELNSEQNTSYNVESDGLKIYTTIDSRMQAYAEAAVGNHLASLQKVFNRQLERQQWSGTTDINRIVDRKLKGMTEEEQNTKSRVRVFDWGGERDSLMTARELALHNLKMLNAGFLAMDSRSGEVKAWVGGINYKHFKYDHVLSRRQVGSTFKPFVYLAALEKGYRPGDLFVNDTISYDAYENWTPHNADNSYGGMYTLKGALTHSVNTVSASLIMNTGIGRVCRLAQNAGIETRLPHVPSLALGTAELSWFELVRAYQSFANMGAPVAPRLIHTVTTRNGDLLYADNRSPVQTGDSIASRENMETIVEMLKNVVNKGTARSLRYRYGLNSEIAGKTGTTQNQADGWFVGFTPDLVAGVWVGAEYPSLHFKSLRYGQGAHTALPIWAGFFKQLYDDPKYKQLASSKFEISDSVRVQVAECEEYIQEPKIQELQPKEFKVVAENQGIQLSAAQNLGLSN